MAPLKQVCADHAGLADSPGLCSEASCRATLQMLGWGGTSTAYSPYADLTVVVSLCEHPEEYVIIVSGSSVFLKSTKGPRFSLSDVHKAWFAEEILLCWTSGARALGTNESKACFSSPHPACKRVPFRVVACLGDYVSAMAEIGLSAVRDSCSA